MRTIEVDLDEEEYKSDCSLWDVEYKNEIKNLVSLQQLELEERVLINVF